MMMMMMIRKGKFVVAHLQYVTPSMHKLKRKLTPDSYLIMLLDFISQLIQKFQIKSVDTNASNNSSVVFYSYYTKVLLASPVDHVSRVYC